MTVRLPQSENLQVPQDKILGYLLDPAHEDGRSKDRFFRKRGFKPEAWEEFADALLKHGATRPVIQEKKIKYGKKFTVECQITTPDGRNPCILSVWIKAGKNAPRLVTAHPNS